MKTKQVIVMRTDLNMRRGKQIAQGAHASMKFLIDMGTEPNERSEQILVHIEKESALDHWINGMFTKVCLGVPSEQELVELYMKAKDAGLICSIITDAGLTEFGGVPTRTCIAIGPAKSEDIDLITGHLKLL